MRARRGQVREGEGVKKGLPAPICMSSRPPIADSGRPAGPYAAEGRTLDDRSTCGMVGLRGDSGRSGWLKDRGGPLHRRRSDLSGQSRASRVVSRLAQLGRVATTAPIPFQGDGRLGAEVVQRARIYSLPATSLLGSRLGRSRGPRDQPPDRKHPRRQHPRQAAVAQPRRGSETCARPWESTLATPDPAQAIGGGGSRIPAPVSRESRGRIAAQLRCSFDV